MSPHEKELLEEIETLHDRLRKSEGAKLRWIFISLLSIAAVAFLLWDKFFR